MERRVTDYWAFIERIHDLTEYVQELLRKNGRLQRRIEDLEKEKVARASQVAEPPCLEDRRRASQPS